MNERNSRQMDNKNFYFISYLSIDFYLQKILSVCLGFLWPPFAMIK